MYIEILCNSGADVLLLSAIRERLTCSSLGHWVFAQGGPGVRVVWRGGSVGVYLLWVVCEKMLP